MQQFPVYMRLLRSAWGVRWFGYYGDEEEPFYWSLPMEGGGFMPGSASITDEKGIADKLLSMEFLDENRVKLVFSRKDKNGQTCEILFSLDTAEIEKTVYR